MIAYDIVYKSIEILEETGNGKRSRIQASGRAYGDRDWIVGIWRLHGTFLINELGFTFLVKISGEIFGKRSKLHNEQCKKLTS